MLQFRLFAALLCIFWQFRRSDAISDVVVGLVNAECAKCDGQFTRTIIEYQQSYGQSWRTSMEAATYYCDKFAQVKQCHVDCVGGRSVTYLSLKKRQFDIFYAQSCDPVCYSTVMPWCYMKFVGQYRLDQSCDRSTASIKSNLARCLVEELFYKQNCNGSCTPGQRRANFIFMQLVSSCLIPLNNQDYCFNWVQYCIGNYYGSSGDDFSLQTDFNLTQSNNVSCDFYRHKFVGCMQRSVNSLVTLGEEPSLTTYDKPCNNYQDQIDYLEDLTTARLTNAVCENPSFSLSDICDASGFAVTPTLRSPASLPTPLSVVITPTSVVNQPPRTSVTPATPTQVSGGDSTNGDSPTTMQSLPSQPSTDDILTSAPPAAETPVGITSQVDSQPTSASGAPPAPTSAPASTSGSVTTARPSSPAPTTRRSLVAGFFDLPSTTPPPTTTRRPRVTLGSGGGAGGGNLLFEGPRTTPGDPMPVTAGDDDLQDSTDDLAGGGDAAETGVRTTRPRRLLISYDDSTSALAAAPLLLLGSLALQVVLLKRFGGLLLYP